MFSNMSQISFSSKALGPSIYTWIIYKHIYVSFTTLIQLKHKTDGFKFKFSDLPPPGDVHAALSPSWFCSAHRPLMRWCDKGRVNVSLKDFFNDFLLIQPIVKYCEQILQKKLINSLGIIVSLCRSLVLNQVWLGCLINSILVNIFINIVRSWVSQILLL